MKKLSLITLLLILSQVANATMYLKDSKGRTFGPYAGDCKSHGRVSNFECLDAPKFRSPREAHIYNDSIIDNSRKPVYREKESIY